MKKHSEPAAGGLEAKTLRGVIARWETRREYLNTNPSAYDAFIAREVAGIAEPALASPAATSAETQGGGGVREALRPLAAIADAYDANELDDEARRFWGQENRHENGTPPERIEIYQGRGGKRLLTLADCFAARAAIALYDHPAPAMESAQDRISVLLDKIEAEVRGDIRSAQMNGSFRGESVACGKLGVVDRIRASLDLAADAEEKP